MQNYFFLVVPILLVLASCSTIPRPTSPVSLASAIMTLPSHAISGMSRNGRLEYLKSRSGFYDEADRRLHHYGDNPYSKVDNDSMLFMRLFEDSNGNTIAASHASRPFADGRDPSESDTFIYRLENGRWKDITESAFSSEIPRTWWFRFNEKGPGIPCGKYEKFMQRYGGGEAYKFGPAEGEILWRDGRFHFLPKRK